MTQCLLYAARGIVATAETNIWMHFRARVLTHVRQAFALDEAAYAALTAAQRKLELMQLAADVCSAPDEWQSPPSRRSRWAALRSPSVSVAQHGVMLASRCTPNTMYTSYDRKKNLRNCKHDYRRGEISPKSRFILYIRV